MKGFILTLVALGAAVPVQRPDQVIDEQSLVVINNSLGSKYHDLLPLMNQLVIYTSTVFPAIQASKSHKIGEESLVQTIAGAVGKSPSSASAGAPSGEELIDVMISLGNVLGTVAGFNPVTMVTNVVGREEMTVVINDLIQFPQKFPPPTENQIVAAEQALLSLGLGLENQLGALQKFLDSFTPEQRSLIEQLQTDIDKKLLAKMIGPDGGPSPALVKEIENQMKWEAAAPTKAEINQALVAIKPTSDGKFKAFLPLMKQIVVYTGVVLPSIEASKENKKNHELTEVSLVQSVAAAAGHQDIEAMLPSSEAMVDAMVAIGRVMGGSSGFNPVELAVNTIGKSELQTVIDDLMRFPLRFPDPSEQQLLAAQQVVLSVGLGFGNQQESIDNFINSLTVEQKSMIDTLEKDIVDKLLGSMMTPAGEPSLKLIEEIKREMRDMELRTGSTAQMPDDFKQMVIEAAKSNTSLDELAHMQALVAVRGTSSTGSFKNFLPLVNQAIVYTSAVLPSIRAHKDHKSMQDLTQSVLVQTFADAAGMRSTSDLESQLPKAEAVLDAMIAIGNVLGGSSGFNPIQMTTNLVGKADMQNIIDELMRFPLRFPEPSEQQITAAEQVVLSVGLGFGNQETAINQFLSTMTEEQKSLITSLQKNVIDKLMNKMMLPDGNPTPALIQEIKKEMEEMEKKTGSADMMPEDFKEIVRKNSAVPVDARAETQALISVQAETSPKSFKDLLPLVNQVIVYSSVVLPSLKAKKEHKHISELTESTLVQTIAASTGSSLAQLESNLPTAEDMLTAMLAIGNVIGSTSGFNPFQLVTNVVGHDNMISIVNEIMRFPFRFPDLTDAQLTLAEQMMLSVGLGFMNQEQALNTFVDSLDTTQKTLLNSMQTNVFEKMMNSLVTADGQPTASLIEEIKREMKAAEAQTGSTAGIPEELKSLVGSS